MAASPLPSPYQPGRFSRVCDQAKTHGIARRSARSMVALAARLPPETAGISPRLAGLEPMRRPPISPSGLIRANQSPKPSSSTSLRKAARAAASIRSAMSR